jgi:hypothetical protein
VGVVGTEWFLTLEDRHGAEVGTGGGLDFLVDWRRILERAPGSQMRVEVRSAFLQASEIPHPVNGGLHGTLIENPTSYALTRASAQGGVGT